jgi:glycosyltransferase involved in cell wall biosynthesis
MMQKMTCLVGIFPPPLHGMSLINLFIKNLIANKVPYYVVDYSPKTLSRGIHIGLYKLFFIPRHFFYLYWLLITRRIGSIYIGLSAGKGQIYDLIFIGLGRLFQRNLYIHHHSYSYINKPTNISKLLFLVAGNKTIHIASTETMRLDLIKRYKVIYVETISGIFALERCVISHKSRTMIQVVGYLSNISFEKGICEFLETAELAMTETPNVKFLLAGPYQDSKIKNYVDQHLKYLNNVEFIGSLMDDTKHSFFESIDLLLFPTKNQDESEGLVIYEAMSMGVPVIVHHRKHIIDILTCKEGVIVDLNEDFANKAVSFIKRCAEDHTIIQRISKAAYEKSSHLKELNTKLIDKLIKKIVEG